MRARDLVVGGALLALAACAAAPADPAGARRHPNVVIILADDLGHGDPRCFSEPSKIPTPHLDRLAAEGMRFTDAHAPASVCSPTRYGLLTGRYCWRTALQRRVLWPWDGPLIAPDRLTLPAMLGRHGYHSACIGKWHLGWTWRGSDGRPLVAGGELPVGAVRRAERLALADRVDYRQPITGGPTERGFDTYFGDDVPNFPPYCWIADDRTVGVPDRQKPEGMFGWPGAMVEGWDLAAVMPELTRRAASYVGERARSGRPFFLFLSLTAPHTPIAPAEPFVGRSGAGRYGDWVHQVDWTVGQVMAALDAHGAREDTLVIFTSDNGSPERDGTDMSGPVGSVRRLGHHPNAPWRGMKGDAWEGGHRVPFIARWPGRVPAGTTCEQPLVLTDLMRTLAAVVGHELPPDAAEDSFDLLPALLGRAPARPIRDHLVHHSAQGVFAVRQGRWKLIFGKGSGGFTRYTPDEDAPPGQLYDLEADPGETDNLWRDRPEIVHRLTVLRQRIERDGRNLPAAAVAMR